MAYRPKAAAGVFVLRNVGLDTEVLLQKRGKESAYEVGHGKYDATASGHVENETESLTMCAKREAMEELGISFDEKDAVFTTCVYSQDGTTTTYIALYYFVDKYTGTPTICEQGKVEALEWFPMNKLPKNLWPLSVVEALKNYDKKIRFSEVGFKGDKK